MPFVHDIGASKLRGIKIMTVFVYRIRKAAFAIGAAAAAAARRPAVLEGNE